MGEGASGCSLEQEVGIRKAISCIISLVKAYVNYPILVLRMLRSIDELARWPKGKHARTSCSHVLVQGSVPLHFCPWYNKWPSFALSAWNAKG